MRVNERQARLLAADPRVASVVQDTRVTLDHVQRNPPSWGLDRVDQKNLPLDRELHVARVRGRGRLGVRHRHRHPDRPQGLRRPGELRLGLRRRRQSAGDGNGHGTHVAGTVAGATYGVAKKAKVVAVRVLDDAGAGTTAQVIAGIDWVTGNAKKPAVANLSLGGYHNAQLDAAVRTSIASGVTYTVAAGNDGLPASLYSPAGVGRRSRSAPPTRRTPGRASNTAPPSTCSRRASPSRRRRIVSNTATATFRVRRWRRRTRRARPRSISRSTDGPLRPRSARHLSPGAASGKVSGRGLGSPNKLVQVGALNERPLTRHRPRSAHERGRSCGRHTRE